MINFSMVFVKIFFKVVDKIWIEIFECKFERCWKYKICMVLEFVFYSRGVDKKWSVLIYG